MKKIALSLIAASALVCMSSNAFAATNFCEGDFCYFGSVKENSNHVQFYCDIDSGVTSVSFENHNVLISGFKVNNPDAGTLDLKGKELQNLKDYYFDVISDPDHKSFFKSVTFKADGGSITCHIGTGNRAARYPGSYGL